MRPGLPWGIYVHVPWCKRRCPYCDFYFEIGRADSGFVDLIQQEWESRISEILSHRPAQSLYFGGGTPSLLKPQQIGALLAYFKQNNALAQDSEVTLEVNPEDVELEVVEQWRLAGINRVSLGIQSFDDVILKRLGRKHTGLEAKAAAELCTKTIDRVCVDWIIGVEQADFGIWETQLKWAIDQGVTHVSTYMLTIEPGTFLEKQIQTGKQQAPSDDLQSDQYEWLQERLPALGLEQYEISSFAKPGFESRHNRLYWSKGQYIGLGPAAHSMSLMPNGAVQRRQNIRDLALWKLEPAAVRFETENLAPFEALLESVAFGLRDLKAGVDIQKLSERHNVGIPIGLAKLGDTWVGMGWLIRKDGYWFLTQLGARFADAIGREILGLDRETRCW